MINICFITGSRAEYCALFPLLKNIKHNKKFNLKLLVTGMHLEKKYGYTYKEILNDKFKITKKIKILSSNDDDLAVCYTMGKCITKVAKELKKIKPDFLVITGDRYEQFAACQAAYVCKIPIIHISGGESTTGAYDEGFRHSISKMSNIHFVANIKYKKRLIKMGENPKNIHVVGGIGVDSFKKTKIISKKEIEEKLKIKLKKNNFVVTHHPETLSNGNNYINQLRDIISSIKYFKDINFIFTMSNSDSFSNKGRKFILKKTYKLKNIKFFNHLGRINYFSLIKNVNGVIGNSSSGILELPLMKKFTINIGDRQKGRLFSNSVFTIKCSEAKIKNAIKKIVYLKNKKFIFNSLYGNGGASKLITNKILQYKLKKINLKKTFYDTE